MSEFVMRGNCYVLGVSPRGWSIY